MDDKPATTELAAIVQSEPVTEKQTAADAVAEAAEDQPEPEDDIDLALESLHKEGNDTEVATKDAAAATSSTAEIIQAEPEAAVKMDVDGLQQMSVKDEFVVVKKEDDPEEEFIKEDAPTSVEAEAVENTNNEIAPESIAEAGPPTGIDDVNLETENIRKVLIDELIAEADAPDADTVAREQPEDVKEVPPTQLPEVDGSEALQLDATKAVVATEELSANNNEEKAEGSPTTTTTAASDATEEKPSTSDAVDVDGKPQALTGTQEKLKSLMNEWVDEDDDNEDENGVSAEAKEQL